MSGLFVSPSLVIPNAELEESFIRAEGPGGQNVNKVASAVQLKFDVAASKSLPESLKARLLGRPDARLGQNGVLTITARRFREQARNRADARARLVELLRRLSRPKKPRRPTKPPLASKKRRAEAKERRGRIKKNRARPAVE